MLSLPLGIKIYMTWSQKKNILRLLFLLCFFASFAFFFPRLLKEVLGEAHFLSAYLYIYGSGIPFFILGISLLLKSKALNLQTAGEKKWLIFFIAGFVYNLLAHGVWILTAVQFPSGAV